MAPLLPSQRRPGSGGSGGSGSKALIKVLLLAMGLGGIVMMQSFASKLGTRPHVKCFTHTHTHTLPPSSHLPFGGCFFLQFEGAGSKGMPHNGVFSGLCSPRILTKPPQRVLFCM